MDFLANKILNKNFFFNLKVMPTHYPQKNSMQQIFIEHRQKTEITKAQKQGCWNQEFKKHITQSSKSELLVQVCCDPWNPDIRGRKRRAERKESAGL